MSAETSAAQGRDEHFLRVFQRSFRTWRGQRPFWAGLFTMLGGLPIAYLPYADLRLGNITLAMATTAGAGSLIIGVLLVTLGLTMWFQAPVRVFSGIAAIVLALISIPVANIGGFLIGFLCALLGGALAISWAPGKPAAEAAGPSDTAEPAAGRHPLDEPDHRDEPTLPAPRADEVYDPNVTGTTAHADGGRNSAG
ncbi:DUF6114 domain-containing protein [Streptomyces zhihengii]|uniref:Integral membrane protein n=1 Tax=Streptomyces zhihengii TaxID=1818004 RepID=A0ABS2UPG0_9ACTN|nr:DUF6114 domain-containing protein [Streptomyces zhihengii]MBM9619283.1 hypothetical protein [Streptomyces zhihengii]